MLEAGYSFCLFDGLNRFYVHPDKADDFAERLAYPACIFDDAFVRRTSAGRRARSSSARSPWRRFEPTKWSRKLRKRPPA